MSKTAPKTSSATTLQIVFEWAGVSPDPVQYKPYSPHYVPKGVCVSVEIPLNNKYVVSHSAKGTVLTPLGAAYCMRKLSTAITLATTLTGE